MIRAKPRYRSNAGDLLMKEVGQPTRVGLVFIWIGVILPMIFRRALLLLRVNPLPAIELVNASQVSRAP